jgi:hypothetical protein
MSEKNFELSAFGACFQVGVTRIAFSFAAIYGLLSGGFGGFELFVRLRDALKCIGANRFEFALLLGCAFETGFSLVANGTVHGQGSTN